MTTYLYRPKHPDSNENGMVEKSLALEWDYYQSEDKSATIGNEKVSIGVISDVMESTRHMANGRYYDSKSEYRKATRAAGCIEVGNETKYLTTPRAPAQLDRGQRREHIRKAVHDLKNARRP